MDSHLEGSLNRTAKTNMKYLLQSFIDVRNEFAHEGASVGLNANDIKRKIADARKFVRHLDRAAYGHITTVSGRASWT